MRKDEMHEFHFIMEKGMKDRLKKINMNRYASKNNDCHSKRSRQNWSLSAIIVQIVKLINPVVKNEHKWGEQRKSRYTPVTEDPDKLREDVHVYFPHYLYRELKMMHADLNCYSIAQLLRGFLSFFLDLVDLHGDNVFFFLKGLFKEWNAEEKQNRLTSRKLVRHMLAILTHLSGQNRLISIYDSQFKPFWLFRL